MKKRFGIFLLCFAILFTNLLPITAYSATADQKAIAAYKLKLKAIKKNDMRSSDKIRYKYVDIDGNGIRELICVYVHKRDVGRGGAYSDEDKMTFRIYTYSKGKVICQLNEHGNIWWIWGGKLRYSKASKAFRLSYNGIIQAYGYYRLKNGKYVQVGYKTGSRSWYYYVNGKRVSKSVYEKHVAGTQKGTCRTSSLGSFWDLAVY